MSEKVLAIKKELLSKKYDLSQEVINVNFEDSLSYFNSNCEFLERPIAEYDFNYKQLIPYIIVKNKSDIYLLKRFKKQTEKRLHNQYSIGLGGHINPSETGDNVVINGLFKELLEEVKLETINFRLKFIGLLNDELTEVSKVHLGFIVFLELEDKQIEVLETEKMEGEWVSVNYLSEIYDSLESWSQIVYTHFLKQPHA